MWWLLKVLLSCIHPSTSIIMYDFWQWSYLWSIVSKSIRFIKYSWCYFYFTRWNISHKLSVSYIYRMSNSTSTTANTTSSYSTTTRTNTSTSNTSSSNTTTSLCKCIDFNIGYFKLLLCSRWFINDNLTSWICIWSYKLCYWFNILIDIYKWWCYWLTIIYIHTCYQKFQYTYNKRYVEWSILYDIYSD